MAKFNRAGARPVGLSPVATELFPSGRTYEGGAGYARDLRSELFLLAVSNLVSEDTFYESGNARDARFVTLIRAAAVDYPEWTAGLLRWLRAEANMRTAPLVGAAEMVKARLEAGQHGLSRQVVASVLRRADEPGEMLAYWTSHYGRTIPKPVKRGVADAVRALYAERALLKYDGDSYSYRFADVLDLCHPKPHPGLPWQGDLFAHALDRRHNRGNPIPEPLGVLRTRAALMAVRPEFRRALLAAPGSDVSLREAGMTWEAVAGWLQGPMDAAAWEAVIPSMGYMALIRNLRNFDEAGVSDTVAEQVAAKLADPDEVARSRQLPLRFVAAHRAAPSLRWSWPLEKAANLSLDTVPELGGRTLILVDTSTSMQAALSDRSELRRWDAAALFGVALGARCAHADVVSFSSSARFWIDPAGPHTRRFPLRDGESLLSAVKRWGDDGFFLGGGTDTHGALMKHFTGHDRVVILTDEQAARGDVGARLPSNVPAYTWNLAGYKMGHAPSGVANRHTFGGLSDAAFRMIPLLEAGRDGAWPWESTPAAA
jgi:TROVE domain-containing protein